MRIAGYILAIVIGVAATIAGFVTKVWLLGGFGLGFLAMSIYRIVVQGQSHVEGKDDAIFAIFDMPIWPDGVISIVIIAAGIGLVFVIFKIAGWA